MKEISLNHPIARGRTADVYDWDEGHVLKLFHNWFERDNIEYELKIARAVHASGVKSPSVGDLIQVQGRNGLIYERVAGKSMLEMIQQKPWKVFQYGRMLAELHAQMHECVFEADIPTQRRKLERKIQGVDVLPAPLKTALTTSLLSLPDGDRVCHGDFHPANVLISGNNATVIDWIDAARGNPLADAARTTVILLGAANTTQTPDLVVKMFTKLSHAVYLREYFRLRPHGMDEYHRWIPIVAAGRLTEGMPELEKWLLEQARKF
ncbi:MAG TPA: aminoglycoside phosphotransferase family protein [Anaerolineales bacterium]|nr:aminoglycoside phosphotransferase family protein [Anaerolineales bacterium]